MNRESYRQTFQIPGTDTVLHVTRAASGQLLSLGANGRTYVEQGDDGRHFDRGLVIMSETLLGKTLLRHVRSKQGNWLERYVWGDDERLVEIDGVTFSRDAEQRIIACEADCGESWRYRYNNDGPVRIDSPKGTRRLHWRQGLLTGMQEAARYLPYRYEAGVRYGVPDLPASWHRDELGRVWTITRDDGTVATTFLWDGFACLGRIDGPVGEPLAAVYSLDPTCTPVRIITADQVIRIPRDAFGEGHLAHPGNPGLYGGLVWQGLVHLPARSLDPRTGTFTKPDPFDGLEADPRRETGYEGPLLIENHSVNRYAVSKYDAVGRADPTGNLSFWVYLSDFTWSLQNNLVGWFGLDWVINLFGSLFTGQIKDFFDYEHLESSDRLGLTGVRRAGVTAPGRVWTFQHLVMSPRAAIHDLARARAIDPKGEFRPTLYGTVLHVKPAVEDPFLLRGTAFANITNWPNGPINWSRAGGPAEAMVPGATTPIFPRGGLHFDNVINRIENPTDASLRELEGRERSVLGTIGNRTVISIAATGTGLAVDQFVLLTDTANNTAIFQLLSVTTPNSTTRIRLNVDNPGVGPNDIRLRQLGAPDPSEQLSQTTEATHLETQGSANNYRPGNAIRLSQAGSVVGACLVERLEVRLALDEAVPATLNSPIKVLKASGSGISIEVTRTANNDGIEYPAAATLPGVGATLVIRGNGNEVPAVVQSVSGQEVRIDRSLTSTGNNTDKVQVEALSRGPELGERRDAPEVAAQITYVPTVIRNGPNSGFVRLEGNNGGIAVRRVTSRVFDAVVADKNLPGNIVDPYDVERFDVTGFDREGLAISNEQVLALSENVNIGTPPALMIQELAGSTIGGVGAGGPSANWSNGNDRLSQQFTGADVPPNFPGPAAPLLIDDGTTREVRRVRTIRVTVTLDREVTVTGGDAAGLRAVRLRTLNSPRYRGKLVGPVDVSLAAGHGLANGDDVSLNFDPAASNPALEYRVSQIGSGNLLTAVGGQTHAVEVTKGTNTVAGTVDGSIKVAAVPLIGSQPVQMPRLNPEAAIVIEWDNTATPLKVMAVNGNKVTLAHRDSPAAIQDLYIKTVTVQQLVTMNPGNGSAWLGINGRTVNGVAADGGRERTTKLSFDVWSPDVLSRGIRLAVADGNRTIPCQISGTSDIEVTITLDRPLDTAADPLSTLLPNVNQTGFALDFVREDRSIIIRDNPALLGNTGNNLVLVTPMLPAQEAARLATGARISPGTVLVPEDPENWELDRRQSLIDHELIHTRQSATWGPLLLGWFPLFALEGLYEGTTDIELPDFSPYLGAELSSNGNIRYLRIPDTGGMSFAQDDQVQIFANGRFQTIKLGAENGANSNQFAVRIGVDVPDQNLQIRKLLNDSNWSTARDVIFNIQQVLTHGGVLNMLTGSVYGGLFFGIGRLFYAMGRAIFGKGDRFPATVVEPDKTSITLDNAAGVTALNGANRIIVQKDDNTVVRSLTSPANGNTLSLSAALEYTGAIFVAPYTTHTPDSAWDWHSYYPAQVPNEAEPAAIQPMPANGGDSLTLSLFDRVVVTSGSNSQRTNVTHVRNNGIVELEDAPPTSGGQREFRIAKIDEGDPMGNVDSIVLRELGMGWMRWIFDPYGQFQYRLQPANDSFWGIVARIARYLFGTTSWSLIFPFGYYFWDNAFVQSGGNGHFSQMEQEASEESGDLYSPIGRLRGAFTWNGDTKRYQGVVGDIGRYWYFHGYRTPTMVTASNRDRPGINWVETGTVNVPFESGGSSNGTEGLRVIPDWTGGGPSGDPNQDAQAGGNTRGLVMPDRFFNKDSANPLNTTATAPTGFAPAVSGYIPVSSLLERSFGMYVSFCRAGQHRVTVPNGIFSGADAYDAQEGDSTFGFGRQTIFFNVDVADVGVTVGGQQVSATRTDDGVGNFLPVVIELVQLQRARVNVVPNGSRRYEVTVPYSGNGGYLQVVGSNEIVAMNRNTPANEPEPVEISRIYRKNDDGSYDDAVLNAHSGVHLAGDVHIPVRSFQIRVVDSLPVRRAMNLDSADVLDPNTAGGKLRPGDEAFVIIPADPTGTLRRTSVTYPSNPAMVTNPLPPVITSETTPGGLQQFVGDGVVSKISLQADNPPQAAARMVFSVEVGYQALRANLTAEIEVIPHLILEPAAGLTVQNNGSTLVLNARTEDGAAANVKESTIRILEPDGTTNAAGLSASVSASQVTITASNTATPGRKQILVEKDSDEHHWARRTFEVIT